MIDHCSGIDQLKVVLVTCTLLLFNQLLWQLILAPAQDWAVL